MLGALTPPTLSNDGVPVHDPQEITVGDVPVRALRVTFVGELGWELYARRSTALALWRALWTPASSTGWCRRLPGDREPAAGEGLPGLEHGHHRGDQPLRGGAGLLREARQARRLRGRDALRAAKERGGDAAAAPPDAGRPGAVALGSEPVGSATRWSGA